MKRVASVVTTAVMVVGLLVAAGVSPAQAVARGDRVNVRVAYVHGPYGRVLRVKNTHLYRIRVKCWVQGGYMGVQRLGPRKANDTYAWDEWRRGNTVCKAWRA